MTFKRFNADIDMDQCYITGIRAGIIERHHVFGAANRTRSTFYGFVVPLVAEIHPNGARRDDKRCQELTGMSVKTLDHELKADCQAYYEEHIGNRDQFVKEFGKNYLD